MTYNIKVTHTSPTFKQFEEWGIQQAYPIFFMDIIFYSEKDNNEIVSFRMKINGNYYCPGSRNFECINISLDSYKINNNITKEQVNNLLNDQNIIKIFANSLEESIKDSMIPNVPIEILEQIWDIFSNDFNNDSNNYLLFRHNKKNILTANICFFMNIGDSYKYIINNFDFIVRKDFLLSYQNYIKNEHNILFSKKYVFSFEYDDNIYELYRIDKDSNNVLLLFSIETQLICYVKGFEKYTDAIEKMKKEYRKTYNDNNIFDDNNMDLLIKNDKVFGMVFRCNKY
jgi:hypothetical protein